jgi:hypothetical protein
MIVRPPPKLILPKTPDIIIKQPPRRVLRRERHIRTNVGEPKSIDEQIEDMFREIIAEIETLDPGPVRDKWIDAVTTFMGKGDLNALLELTKWRREVVPLDEFIFSDGYLRQRPSDIYPGVWAALEDIDTDKYDEIIELGAIGIGKTTLANLGTARDLYKLSCMRNPHQVYGIGTGTPIVFTIQSVRLSTAKKVVFNELGRYIRESPYFKQKFPFDKLITSEMIFHEHNISILPVSSSGTAAISMNVIGGQLDEVNFMMKTLKSKSSQADEKGEFDQAKELYNTISSRRKSRFLNRGNLPGALYLISSSRFPDDFTEIKAKQSFMRGGPETNMYVFGGSQWEIKGRDNRDFFTEEEFTVQIGNESYPSKVLARDEDTGENTELPAPGTETIQVPMTFYQDFLRDVEGELRNAAGRTTLSTAPFITQRGRLREAVELAKENGYLNPMGKEEYELSQGLPDLDRRLTRTDVHAPRHCHIDLGITKDACGFAVGHVAGHKVTEHTDAEGRKQTEIMPVIAYDVICRIVPPMGGEIELEQVRKLLRKIKHRYKIPVESVTFDGFQSVDSRQILARAGFKVGYLSVEKIEPWRAFRDALYDGRILLTEHAWVQKELAEVERVVKNNNEKVDHRPNGTKDVADAVVGVATFLLRRRQSWNSASYHGGRTGLFLLGDAKRSKTPANVINDDAETPETGRASTNRRKTIRRSFRRK